MTFDVRLVPRTSQGVILIRHERRGQWELPTFTLKEKTPYWRQTISDGIIGLIGIPINAVRFQLLEESETELSCQVVLNDREVLTNIISVGRSRNLVREATFEQVRTLAYDRAKSEHGQFAIRLKDRELLVAHDLLEPPREITG
jgi:hypothetical protein